ncbi:MAG: LptF/LptG family permease [Bacteroidota bacterium]|nr:LptF/LptG family permease [Bacteroidota bacterium]
MKKIDRYIIKKFLGTFFFTLMLILVIVVIFDISEKIDEFLENKVPVKEILFGYYINFIPYFGNLFSPLFIFISVIFLTSRMAGNTEIIAIFNSGMSFNRLLRPFIKTAFILSVFSFILANFIIPISNEKRIKFETNYLDKEQYISKQNIHVQIKKNQYVHVEHFNNVKNIGYKFTLENFQNGKLISKIRANNIKYDTTRSTWQILNYETRIFNENGEYIKSGNKIDTVLNLKPSDFTGKKQLAETMNIFELNKYIQEEEIKGSENIIFYKIVQQKRIAFPLSAIILTVIAVAISSKRVRGGIGTHLAIGLAISFSYILFMQISTTFAINSDLAPTLAVWIPNIIYSIVAIILVQIRGV